MIDVCVFDNHNSDKRTPFVIEAVDAHDGLNPYWRLKFDRVTVFLDMPRLQELADTLKAAGVTPREAQAALNSWPEIPKLEPLTCTVAKLTAPEFQESDESYEASAAILEARR